MMKRMSMVARHESRRLKEFLISLLARTMIEIMFPKIPRTPTIVWKCIRLIYSRIKFLGDNKMLPVLSCFYFFCQIADSEIFKIFAASSRGRLSLFNWSKYFLNFGIRSLLANNYDRSTYLPEALPRANRHTGQRSAGPPHPFGRGFHWV